MPAHILIIEDNEMSLVLAEHLLRQAGYETSTAADGSAGVRMAMENTADLILCDLDLPSMDGAEVLDALRTHSGWRAVPVIAFTVAAADEDQRQKLAAGFDGSIMKPIDPRTFAAAIEPYLAPELRAPQS
jgi:CheY-like chemotaxis protein